MRRLILLFAITIVSLQLLAQNPATVFTIPNRHILLPCGTSCTSINVQVPHIKQTTTYTITNPPYVPYAYTTPGGTEIPAFYSNIPNGDDV